jgi:hypothetical protein
MVQKFEPRERREDHFSIGNESNITLQKGASKEQQSRSQVLMGDAICHGITAGVG